MAIIIKAILKMKDKALIIYHSFSGNTEEISELIKEELLKNGFEVDVHKIGFGNPPEPMLYDLCFIGTFTWEKGMIPEEVEDFLDFTNLPENTAVFGSGDTQFGGDSLFCKAVLTIYNRYSCRYLPLKIEQSPRGSQEIKVNKWIKSLIETYRGEC